MKNIKYTLFCDGVCKKRKNMDNAYRKVGLMLWTMFEEWTTRLIIKLIEITE